MELKIKKKPLNSAFFFIGIIVVLDSKNIFSNEEIFEQSIVPYQNMKLTLVPQK